MASVRETEGYVHVQPRRNGVDVYRLNRNPEVIRQEYFGLESVEKILEERLDLADESLRESQIFLGLNLATAAVLFVEAIRRRSKTLATVSLLPVVGVVYAGTRAKKHKSEVEWLVKEVVEVESHMDNF